jgi:hypothetical protein
MPGDDVTTSGSLSVAAADASFNWADTDTEEERFPILVSGEYCVIAGFDNAENNGRFKVLSRTPSKLVVDAELVDETSPSGDVTLTCRTLPRDLESHALTELRARYLASTRDPSIVSESLGDWSATYSDPSAADQGDFGGLTARVARGLHKYQRVE